MANKQPAPLPESLNHKLRSPIASLKACVYLLRSHVGTGDEKTTDYLDKLDAHLDKLMGRVDALLKGEEVT